MEKLGAAEEAFNAGDSIGTSDNIVSFAQIAWQLDPFAPSRMPENAEDITKGWLAGKSVAELASNGGEVGEFIEDALVYRLTWAIEATRIWFNTENDENESDEPSPLVPCIEHGTLDKTALVFLNAGLRSRIAAEIVALLADSVKDRRTLRRWLKKPETQELADEDRFPTPDTHFQWVQFVEDFLSAKASVAQRESESLYPEWSDTSEQPEQCLALSSGEGRWELYSDDMRRIGSATSEKGVRRGTIWLAEASSPNAMTAMQWSIPR
jgi:hypothetical protein